MSEFAREAGFYCSPQKPNSGRWVELLGVGTLGGFFSKQRQLWAIMWLLTVTPAARVGAIDSQSWLVSHLQNAEQIG